VRGFEIDVLASNTPHEELCGREIDVLASDTPHEEFCGREKVRVVKLSYLIK
jgi:hypothetical protein